MSSAHVPLTEGITVEKVASTARYMQRDARFWLVFLAIGTSTVITALELSAVSTALPSIVSDLQGSTFVWVGSAYALSATAFIPIGGGLAQIFGRKSVILSSLLMMAVGSALCGAATSMNFLIAGRTIQGLGGGGIASTTAIIISDLVPLRERGVFNGLIGIAWSVASGAGPIIGGALAQAGQWRWLFYLNIPISAVAAVLFVSFFKVRTPEGTWKEKLRRVDWLGNAAVIATTTSCVIALTYSGVEHPWTSALVLVPLILGLLGLIGFVIYEAYVPEHPIVPFILMSTATGISGYLQTFIMPVVMLGIIYYVPVFLQACKGALPIPASLDQLGFALVVAPTGVISGVSVQMTRKYRPQMWTGWALLIIGTGLLTTLHQDSSRGCVIVFVIMAGAGIGILTTTTYFPVLAPSFFMFARNFAQVWGITIGGSVLQNELRKRIPAAFLSEYPGGTAIAYATIPLISGLEEPLRTEIRTAFAQSLQVVWQVFLGIAGLGFLCSLIMKGLPLHSYTDKDWGLEDKDAREKPSGADSPEIRA